MPIVPVDTAIQVIMGPLIDDTDFKSRETAVAHNAAGMDVALIKSSVTGTPTFTALTPTTGGTQDWVHLGDGFYYLEITAAQNDTEGELMITGFATGVLPWRSVQYTVVPTQVFNSLVLGTDKLETDNVQWLGGTIATPTATGVPEVDVTHWIGTAAATPTVAGVPEVDLTHVAGATTNVSALATNVAAILDDTGTSGVVLNAAGLAADAVTEIRALASGTSDSGTTGTMVDAARTEADTDYWAGNIIVFTSGNIAGQARLITGFTPGTDTITFSPPTTQAVATQTYEIWPQSYVTMRGTATNAIVAGSIGTDAIGADELAADAIAEIAAAVWDRDATGHQTQGTFGQAIGDPVADTNTIYKAVVTDAAGANVAADIVAVKAETATILADTNELQTDWVNGGRLDLILDARASQTSVDDLPTNAELATALDPIPTAAENADAVWDEDATAHQTTGTFGQAIGDPVADTNTIYGAVVTGAVGATIAADIITIDDILDTEFPALVTAVADLPTNAELATALDVIPTAAENADAMLDDAIPEPSGVFAWPATARNILAWEGALARNKRTQSATTQTLRNDADSADIATAGTDDTAGVTTREEWA